jgi:hypothetical protein
MMDFIAIYGPGQPCCITAWLTIATERERLGPFIAITMVDNSVIKHVQFDIAIAIAIAT